LGAIELAAQKSHDAEACNGYATMLGIPGVGHVPLEPYSVGEFLPKFFAFLGGGVEGMGGMLRIKDSPLEIEFPAGKGKVKIRTTTHCALSVALIVASLKDPNYYLRLLPNKSGSVGNFLAGLEEMLRGIGASHAPLEFCDQPPKVNAWPLNLEDFEEEVFRLRLFCCIRCSLCEGVFDVIGKSTAKIGEPLGLKESKKISDIINAFNSSREELSRRFFLREIAEIRSQIIAEAKPTAEKIFMNMGIGVESGRDNEKEELFNRLTCYLLENHEKTSSEIKELIGWKDYVISFPEEDIVKALECMAGAGAPKPKINSIPPNRGAWFQCTSEFAAPNIPTKLFQCVNDYLAAENIVNTPESLLAVGEYSAVCCYISSLQSYLRNQASERNFCSISTAMWDSIAEEMAPIFAGMGFSDCNVAAKPEDPPVQLFEVMTQVFVLSAEFRKEMKNLQAREAMRIGVELNLGSSYIEKCMRGRKFNALKKVPLDENKANGSEWKDGIEKVEEVMRKYTSALVAWNKFSNSLASEDGEALSTELKKVKSASA
jgi:hypothetical protein